MPQPPAPPAPTPPPPAPAPPDPSPQPPQPTQTVPYDRFASVNAAKTQAEQERDAAIARAEAAEAATQSELQREQTARQRAEQRAQDAEARLSTTLRDNAVRGAAMTPHDTRGVAIDGDAIAAMIATGQYGEVKPDDPATVDAALTKLHELKPTLFAAPAPPAQPTSFGLPAGTPPPAPTDPAQPNPQDTERGSMGRAMMTMLRGPGSGQPSQ